MKGALVLLVAFVAFVLATLQWGATLDGRSDPCARAPRACADPSTTAPSTTTTTAPSTTTAPAPTTTAAP